LEGYDLRRNGKNVALKVVNAMKIKKEWEEFVSKHPHGNIFQSPHLAEVFERAKGIEPVALAAIHEDTGEICASMLAYVMKYTNIFSSFASRARIRGGPLYLDTEEGILAAKALLKYYDNVVRKKALYTDIWNLWDINSTASALFRDAGYIYENKLNFLIDLTMSRDKLWTSLARSKRKAIRKGREKGVYIEEARDRSQVATFYRILKETYRRIKVPLEDISLFESSFDVLMPKNMFKLFLAYYNNECIGGRIILMYKGTIYAWYISGSRAYSKMYPSAMLMWHTIEWGSENGYHTFDLGGAGKPDEEYGPRQFKKEFGGKLVNFGCYKKIHSQKKLWLAEKGFGIYKKLRW